jgi:hypothetical protein
MAFIPLVSLGRVIGKFMLYYAVPTELSADELQLVTVATKRWTRTITQAGWTQERSC